MLFLVHTTLVEIELEFHTINILFFILFDIFLRIPSKSWGAFD